MSNKVTLKKYANRRLYDTDKSRYITLEEVAEMIKSGKTVEVRDAKTKEDVTSFILTQIILEEARKKNVLLPVPLLHLIIQHGQGLLVEFFEQYLEQTLRSYIDYRKEADQQFGKWLEFGSDFSNMAKKTMDFSQSFFDTFSGMQSQDRKDGEKKDEEDK